MDEEIIAKQGLSWQIIFAWCVGCIGVINIILINVFSLEQVRSSLWMYTVAVVYILQFGVTLNAVFREKVIRGKLAWLFISLTSLILLCRVVFRSVIREDDIWFVVLIFMFTILGLVIYFPGNVWSLGNTSRVICDIVLLSFSLISLLQSGIYYEFGMDSSARSAASYSVWVGFEIAGLINTIFLWHRYRQRILGLIVIAVLCIVLADVTGTIRQWYPGIYRVSGLPDISFNHIQKMVIMLFAYYSVNNFIDFGSDEKRLVSWLEWLYRTGVPRIAFITSLAATIFVHPPDRWVTVALFAVALLQWAVSVNEEYRLFERLFQANAALVATVAELRATQDRLHQALLDAEELAVQEERRRLALEIHDGMGHHLTNASATPPTPPAGSSAICPRPGSTSKWSAPRSAKPTPSCAARSRP